jgi:hypothetical protein
MASTKVRVSVGPCENGMKLTCSVPDLMHVLCVESLVGVFTGFRGGGNALKNLQALAASQAWAAIGAMSSMKHAEQCAKIGPEYQNQVRSCPAMWCSHLPHVSLICTGVGSSLARICVFPMRAHALVSRFVCCGLATKPVYQGIPLPSDIKPDTFSFEQYMSPVSGSSQKQKRTQRNIR